MALAVAAEDSNKTGHSAGFFIVSRSPRAGRAVCIECTYCVHIRPSRNNTICLKVTARRGIAAHFAACRCHKCCHWTLLACRHGCLTACPAGSTPMPGRATVHGRLAGSIAQPESLQLNACGMSTPVLQHQFMYSVGIGTTTGHNKAVKQKNRYIRHHSVTCK